MTSPIIFDSSPQSLEPNSKKLGWGSLIDLSKVPEYEQRSVAEWRQHIEARLAKLSSDDASAKEIRKRYTKDQTHYLVHILQRNEARLNETEKNSLVALVRDLNNRLIYDVAKSLLDYAYKNHKLCESDIDELKSSFYSKAAEQTIKACTQNYNPNRTGKDGRRADFSTYLYRAMERAFWDVWKDFFDQKNEAPISLTQSSSDEDQRNLAARLADPRASLATSELEAGQVVEKVRTAINSMPEEWPSKTKFPLSPPELIRKVHGIETEAQGLNSVATELKQSHGIDKDRTEQRYKQAEKILSQIIQMDF